MCVSPSPVARVHSQSVPHSQVHTADAGTETLAFSLAQAGRGPCSGNLLAGSEHRHVSGRALKILRSALWFPFSRAPG